MDLQIHPADAASVNDALRRMQLLQPGETPTLTALTGGVSSLIVRADTAGGMLCVKQALPQLKVAALWEAPVERNRAEVAWMRLAATIEPKAVPAILGDDAQGNAFAMAFLDPNDHPVWKAQLLKGDADADTAATVGQRLVRIHSATADRPELARQFANDANFHALRLEPYLVTAAQKHTDCVDALLRLVAVTAGTRRALVHGDVSPKNILVGPDGPIFLDAECAWYGDPAFDLAFCLNHLLLKSVWRPAATSAFLHCFDALAASYLAGVDWEPVDGFEARVAALLPGLLLARIDGKSPVEYITSEADREWVRRFAIPLLQSPESRLVTIRQRWSAA